MGRGRARAGALRGTLLAAAILGAAALAGCGAESHPNEPRPQGSTRVSITVGPNEVIVQPPQVAMSPERNQQIPQNRNQPQPEIKGDKRPLNVVFVTANQTDDDTAVTVEGPASAGSDGKIYAHSPGTFGASLPAGTYTIEASDIPGARPAKLVVGTFRASSENDLLLP